MLILLLGLYTGQGQNDSTADPGTDLGLSVQLYPAGIIPTVNLEHYIKEDASILLRLGANITDRQDFSDENDEEEGAGFGATAGYRKHFEMTKGKIIAGLNLDLWNLWIDWRDDVGTVDERSGTSYVFVVQPWLEGGYFFDFRNSDSQLGITLGFGREINLITNGDEVAQDFIGSISLQYMFGF